MPVRALDRALNEPRQGVPGTEDSDAVSGRSNSTKTRLPDATALNLTGRCHVMTSRPPAFVFRALTDWAPWAYVRSAPADKADTATIAHKTHPNAKRWDHRSARLTVGPFFECVFAKPSAVYPIGARMAF